jgi:hypothetical protein
MPASVSSFLGALGLILQLNLLIYELDVRPDEVSLLSSPF